MAVTVQLQIDKNNDDKAIKREADYG